MLQRHKVRKVDGGLVPQLSSSEVGWSRGRNVRFAPGSVSKSFGKTLLATTPGALSIRKIKSFKGHDAVVRSVVCCDNKIFAYQSGFTAFSDITPTIPPSGISYNWQFGIIGGMLFITNGINAVWKWPNYAGRLVPALNFPARVGAMTTSNNRIIVGNILQGLNSYPARSLWSGILNPETFTIDRKGSSGRRDFLDPNGQSDAIEVIRAYTHRGHRTLVYTDRNIWHMDPVEFPVDYRADILYPGKGLLSPQAIISIEGIDYYMGSDGFYMHGAGAPVPFDFSIRDEIFNNLNKEITAINSAFAFEQPETKEVGFCVATGTNLEPDTAAIYQRETKTWTICDCNYLCVNDSRQDPSYSGAFGGGGFGAGAFGGGTDINLIPYPVVGNKYGQILKLDDGFNDNGEAFTGYIESGDFSGSSSFVGKVCHAVSAHLTEQPGITEPLMIQVGTRKSLSDPINWSVPKQFKLGIDDLVDIKRKGKWLRLRFYTDQIDSPWEMEGYEFIFSEEEDIR